MNYFLAAFLAGFFFALALAFLAAAAALALAFAAAAEALALANEISVFIFYSNSDASFLAITDIIAVFPSTLALVYRSNSIFKIFYLSIT